MNFIHKKNSTDSRLVNLINAIGITPIQLLDVIILP